jgi:cytochrome c oxidase subunit 2
MEIFGMCKHWLKINRLFLLIALGFSSIAQAIPQFNMTRGVTPVSHDIFQLHMTIFWICTAIGVVVFGIMLVAILKHRKSLGHKASHFHESVAVEIIWTIIPFLILIAMAIPATKVLIRLEDAKNPDINIKVTGIQWKWQYDYIDEGFSFISNLKTPEEEIQNLKPKNPNYLLEVDNEVVVPVNKKIRFLTTAQDVIHSWWVPALGVKKDSIPGFINEAWATIEEPGVYRGQCAELCGRNHGFMPIVVRAVSETEYAEWVAQKLAQKSDNEALSGKTLSLEELMTKGEEVYKVQCVACHQTAGQGLPGVFPALKDSPVAKGDIAKHIDMVLNGKNGTAMQAFGKMLNDYEIAAVVTYERNAWGNNTGDAVQPMDIQAARK